MGKEPDDADIAAEDSDSDIEPENGGAKDNDAELEVKRSRNPEERVLCASPHRECAALRAVWAHDRRGGGTRDRVRLWCPLSRGAGPSLLHGLPSVHLSLPAAQAAIAAIRVNKDLPRPPYPTVPNLGTSQTMSQKARACHAPACRDATERKKRAHAVPRAAMC